MTADYSVAGDTECFVAGDVERSVTQNGDISVAGGAENMVAGGTEYLGCILGLFCMLPSQSSSCSSLFLQMWQCGPHEHLSVVCLGITMAQGIAATWGGSSVLMMGAGVGTGAGGIGQSFLVLNKFSEVNPALGQGVLCPAGHWVYLPLVEGWILHFGVW